MGRIMAFDYGGKRVGIAVTDPFQIIANGLETIEREKLLDFIEKYIRNEPVETFVIGLPFDTQGKPTDATGLVAHFIKQLKKKFPEIPVETIDETYTSKMAMRTMIDAGAKKKKRRDKGTIDKISATIILQSYLEGRK